MKKKFLECPRHGETLFRCKRTYTHTKKSEWSDDYNEKCFKCISEGRYKKKEIHKKDTHLSFR